MIFILVISLTFNSCQLGIVKNPRVSIEEIEEGIRKHIKENTDPVTGFFHIQNDGQKLFMKLVRVHTEYLSNLGTNRHFACVDLAEEKGEVYDVDFFLEGKPGKMSVTETTVHKLNGRPYYVWEQHEDKTWHRVPVDEASTKLLGVIEGEDEFEFQYAAVLPEIKGDARMWIPIASADDYQSVEMIKIDIPGKYELIRENEFGNTVLFAELGPENSKQTLQINYRVRRKEKGPYKDAAQDYKKFLSADNLVPVGGRFQKIAEEAIIAREADTPLMQARALYDYIIDNMDYQKAGTYGTGDANIACDIRTGNCTEFHSFFISLARSAGIPARFAIGASIPSERNEGGIDGYHCWAEFYAEGKWWPVDISEGNKYTPLATYYFGHHPANRIELSRGRDLVVEPQLQNGPINFLAYPILEMNGTTMTPKTTFSFSRTGNS